MSGKKSCFMLTVLGVWIFGILMIFSPIYPLSGFAYACQGGGGGGGGGGGEGADGGALGAPDFGDLDLDDFDLSETEFTLDDPTQTQSSGPMPLTHLDDALGLDEHIAPALVAGGGIALGYATAPASVPVAVGVGVGYSVATNHLLNQGKPPSEQTSNTRAAGINLVSQAVTSNPVGQEMVSRGLDATVPHETAPTDLSPVGGQQPAAR